MTGPTSWDELAKEAIAHPAFQPAFARFISRLCSPYIDNTTPKSLADRRESFSNGVLALAHFLRDTGQLEIAVDYHELGEALFDLKDQLPHPLFKVPPKSGRSHNTSAVWRLQARICAGIRHLIVGGITEADAVSYVLKTHGKAIAKLLRPGADLHKSVPSWLAAFEADKVSNDLALEDYKSNLATMRALQTAGFQAELFVNLGYRKIDSAAAQASSLP